jgi:hypothetical protein
MYWEIALVPWYSESVARLELEQVLTLVTEWGHRFSLSVWWTEDWELEPGS